jgi:hypothetical protein
MSDDITKTVIRIIQDYCFDNSASTLSDKFSMTIAPLVTKQVKNKKLDLSKFREIAKKRNDFFIANDIDFTDFCKGLFRRLNYELSFYTNISFLESIITFKRKMENGNFRGFPKKSTSEDTLRSSLALYIQQETFCEPRSAAGNNDITVPSEKVIIETKLWNGIEYYQSGFPELNEYLDKIGYCEGYYIVFDYSQTENEIIKTKGDAFDIEFKGKEIHVIFIKMNAMRPSKIYKTRKASQAIPD